MASKAYSRGQCEACDKRRITCRVCGACLRCHDLRAKFVIKKGRKLYRVPVDYLLAKNSAA